MLKHIFLSQWKNAPRATDFWATLTVARAAQHASSRLRRRAEVRCGAAGDGEGLVSHKNGACPFGNSDPPKWVWLKINDLGLRGF